MIEASQVAQVKEAIEGILQSMAVSGFSVTVGISLTEEFKGKSLKPASESVDVEIELPEPNFLTGGHGQALGELQYLVRLIVSKKLQKPLYVKIDVNGYKKKKVEQVKILALDLAEQAVAARQEKVLPPMSSYERMVVHSVLAERSDISTESRGEGVGRCVAIKPI